MSNPYDEPQNPLDIVIGTGAGALRKSDIITGGGGADLQPLTKEPFNGSTTFTKNFATNMNGLVISNDGTADLTFTIGVDTFTVKSGEIFEGLFDAFKTVRVNTNVAYRAYGLQFTGYIGGTPTTPTPTVPPTDTTPPVVTISPVGGVYLSAQSVTLSANESATIYYTLDGSNPTTSSAVYTSPLSIQSNSTLKFFGRDLFNNVSSIQTAAYTINAVDTTPPTITVSPVGGTYGNVQSVTLSANEQATIYFTLDGSTPTAASPVYTAPISISANTTLKYYGVDSATNASAVQSVTYNINTTALSDNFDRANSSTTLGVPWAVYGGSTYGIDNNMAYLVSDGGANSFQFAAVQFNSPDATTEMDFVTVPNDSANNPRLVFRCVDPNNFWGFACIDNNSVPSNSPYWTVYKYVGGAVTNVNTLGGQYLRKGAPISKANGQHIKVVCAGDLIQAYVDNVLVHEFTDTFNNTAKLFGWSGQRSTLTRVDNFVVKSNGT